MNNIITSLQQTKLTGYKFYFKIGAIAVFLTLIIYFFVSKPKSSEYVVILTDSGFSPSQLTIKQGDLVTFTTTLGAPFWPASDPHPLHTLYPEFDPKKPIAVNQSWKFKFNKIGNWEYHDHLFPSFGGKIIVLSNKDIQIRNQVLTRETITKMVDKEGPEKVYSDLEKIYDSNSTFAHSTFHLFGEILYTKFKLSGIDYCDNFAGFGCYHGLFIKAVSDKGLDVAIDLDQKCVEKFGIQGLGCPHGIGHGLVEYFGIGKIKEALSICAKLSWQGPLFGCAGGVFMENNFPTVFDKDGVGKVTVREAHGNLFEPCLSLDSKFKQACYFEQASWWNKVLNSDYQKIGNFCNSLKVSNEKESCLLGLGNAIAESTQYDPSSIVKGCSQMPNKPTEMLCRAGGAWAFFSNLDKRPQSEEICSGLGVYQKLCLDKRILVK